MYCICIEWLIYLYPCCGWLNEVGDGDVDVLELVVVGVSLLGVGLPGHGVALRHLEKDDCPVKIDALKIYSISVPILRSLVMPHAILSFNIRENSKIVL